MPPELPKKKYRSFEKLAGHWDPDPEFDRIMEEQRRIDEELWQRDLDFPDE